MLLLKPVFGLIEVLPCALAMDDLRRIEIRIKGEVKKEGAVFSLKKIRVNNNLLKATLTYDWTVLDDYGGAGEVYINRVREITHDIKSMSLYIRINGVIVLQLNMKRQESYFNPPLSLCNFFSRIVVKPLWTLGVLEEIEHNVIPNYFYQNIQDIVSRDVWPRFPFHLKGEPIDEKILFCLIENLKKNLKVEPSGRLRDISDFWTNIVFLSIYCERIQVLLAIENPQVQCLIENYKSRISQLQYLGMQRFFDRIVNEVRWSLL